MGRRRQLRTSLWVPRPCEDVLPFFADAHNLDELTPPWLRFEILTPPPIAMNVGTLIDYRIAVRGLKMRWRTQITDWQPPHRFVDEQIRGPYRVWRHEHTFEPERSGTQLADHVEFESRGGPLAPLLHKLFVVRDVERIFAFRQQRMAELFR